MATVSDINGNDVGPLETRPDIVTSLTIGY
jgi:hypothetical protein